ncbi:MAG: hypothetical protein ACTSVV_06990, partial [Promethearchaeota archaeon]
KEVKQSIKISEKLVCNSIEDVKNIVIFNEYVTNCYKEMYDKIKVNIVKNDAYLNWRYIFNPRIKYDCLNLKDNEKWLAFLVARQERFYPTNIYGTRILDLAGNHKNAQILIEEIISRAIKRGDSFMDFFFTGNYYERVMEELQFIELKDEKYVWFPLVSSPIEFRENHEFIFLGSKKYPHLFNDIKFSELYFTRGDADRDRPNIIK